jgi:hypothetical protein
LTERGRENVRKDQVSEECLRKRERSRQTEQRIKRKAEKEEGGKKVEREEGRRQRERPNH